MRLGCSGKAAITLLLGCTLNACNGCDRAPRARGTAKQSLLQCTSVEDCEDDNPCTREVCAAGRCLASPLALGANCANSSPCDGQAKCDGKGRCIASPAPIIDDGNACTNDSCDPVRGTIHEQITIDDFDACTADACDARTSQITHTSLPIDDHDDCTFDSCDPKAGIKHQKPNAIYSCEALCGPGFHAASRTSSRDCGPAQGQRTFCMPDCGSSFYVCDVRCPPGYHSSARALSTQCGASSSPRTFCQKNTGEAFHTCDAHCPPSFRKISELPSSECGAGGATKIFCNGPTTP